MNKLSKEKRDRLILVCAGIGVVLITIYFLLIRPLQAAITKTKSDTAAGQTKYGNMDKAIKTSDNLTSQLNDASDELVRTESDLAFGDPNAWFYDTLRHFKDNYKVDIVVGQTTIGDVDLLPHFPYKQLSVNVSGTAYYHDLGKFIADFENAFPHARITNLSLAPVGGDDENKEKLSFHMEIITLIKQTQTQS